MATLTMKPKHAALQRIIGYQFEEPGLPVRALTHRSFGIDNNERLEFIGDGLVNAVVAELLFAQYPDLDEGSLSRLRSKLVSKEGLAILGVDSQWRRSIGGAHAIDVGDNGLGIGREQHPITFLGVGWCGKEEHYAQRTYQREERLAYAPIFR